MVNSKVMFYQILLIVCTSFYFVKSNPDLVRPTCGVRWDVPNHAVTQEHQWECAVYCRQIGYYDTGACENSFLLGVRCVCGWIVE